MKKNTEIPKYTPERFNEATLIHKAETGSPEWAQWREQGIGGSEVSTSLGLNEYKSPYSLWAERTGKIDIEPVHNWSVRFGKAFEDPILKLWEEDNPEWTVWTTGTFVDNHYPFLQASPDALAINKETGEWIVIEIKTARYAWDSLPVGYRAQVMHYLDVLSINRGLVVAVAGWNWFESWVEYDEFEALAQREEVARFWKMVTENREPDFDGAHSTYETVRKLNPEIDPDQECEITESEDDLLREFQREYDIAELQFTELKSRILSKMKKAKTAFVVLGGKKITVATRQVRGSGLPYLQIKKGR